MQIGQHRYKKIIFMAVNEPQNWKKQVEVNSNPKSHYK